MHWRTYAKMEKCWVLKKYLFDTVTTSPVYLQRVWECPKALSYEVSSNEATSIIYTCITWGRITSYWGNSHRKGFKIPPTLLPPIAWGVSKRILKTQKQKFWFRIGGRYEEMVLKTDALLLLHDAAMAYPWMSFFCNTSVPQFGEDAEAQVPHII